MNNLMDVINDFNKNFSDGRKKIITEGIEFVDYESIPFTSPMLNYMLHGGFPRGKIVEFFGQESSGKTTTAIDICANAQKYFQQDFIREKEELENKLKEKSNKQLQGDYDNLIERGVLKVCYFDLEQTFDEKWAVKLGLDTKKIIFVRPDGQSAEKLLDLAEDLLKTGQIGLLVIDSIPALVPQKELDNSLDEQTMGLLARLMGRTLPKVIPDLNKHKASLLLINQMRESMGSYTPYTTPGGKAIKFYSALRLRFKEGPAVDEDNKECSYNSNKVQGNIVEVNIEKSKICEGDRLLGYYTLNYFKGIDYWDGFVSILIAHGYIKQAGSFFTLIDENGEVISKDEKELKVQGKNNLYKLFEENKDIYSQYKEILSKIIKK